MESELQKQMKELSERVEMLERLSLLERLCKTQSRMEDIEKQTTSNFNCVLRKIANIEDRVNK